MHDCMDDLVSRIYTFIRAWRYRYASIKGLIGFAKLAVRLAVMSTDGDVEVVKNNRAYIMYQSREPTIFFSIRDYKRPPPKRSRDC